MRGREKRSMRLVWKIVDIHAAFLLKSSKNPLRYATRNSLLLADCTQRFYHFKTLNRMAKELECEVFLICKRKGKEGEIAELLVREVREDKYMDVRIAVCGNVDAGKR